MYGLLSPSWSSPSSLHLKGPAATLFRFDPFLLSLELLPLLDLAIYQYLLDPTLSLSLPLPLPRPLLPLEGGTESSSSSPLSPSSFMFSFFFALSDSACLFSLLPLSSALDLLLLADPWPL